MSEKYFMVYFILDTFSTGHFKRLYFLLVHFRFSKIQRNGQQFPMYLLHLYMLSFLHYQYPPPEWCICYNWCSHTDALSQVSCLYKGSLLMLYTPWVWTNVWHVSTINNIIQGSFTTLKIISVLLFNSLFPLTLDNPWSFH